MSQLNREAILSKPSRMVDCFDNLKRFEAISLAEYLKDGDRQLIVERQLELLIQSALDLNKAFLKRAASPTTPASINNYESFILMGE